RRRVRALYVRHGVPHTGKCGIVLVADGTMPSCLSTLSSAQSLAQETREIVTGITAGRRIGEEALARGPASGLDRCRGFPYARAGFCKDFSGEADGRLVRLGPEAD